MRVFAYGIEPREKRGVMPDADGFPIFFRQDCYLHYWIDEDLNYQEREKDSMRRPKLVFCERPGLTVTLYGPRNFTINRSGGGTR